MSRLVGIPLWLFALLVLIDCLFVASVTVQLAREVRRSRVRRQVRRRWAAEREQYDTEQRR